MDILEVAAGIACSFLILLFALIVFVENPEKKMFEKTVEFIMIQEKMSSHNEVMDSFPDLKDIKSNIERIGYLSGVVHNITAGPTPNSSKDESEKVQAYTQEIRELRKSVKKELCDLKLIYQELTVSAE